MIEKEKQPGDRRIAVLIDGDNAQPSLIEKILAEASKYGSVTIRRNYGDWTTSNMNGWKDTLQTYAVQPIQQFRYTVGKNATDSAMIIDAMDILYGGSVDGFCLVSSDSDYTRLATRIREKGFFVMGIGQKKTPRAFVNACDVFVYTENLMPKQVTKRSSPKKNTKSDKEHQTPDPAPLLKQAFDIAVQEDGWAFLGTFGHHLRQLDPSFDARTYGHSQLSTLVRAYSKLFEIKEVKSPEGNSVIYVRWKE
ncbi:MAG TPA: Maebl [Anaerolineaceae bacterium]|nr:Maebl [Anaerolineaceae bacterium]